MDKFKQVENITHFTNISPIVNLVLLLSSHSVRFEIPCLLSVFTCGILVSVLHTVGSFNSIKTRQFRKNKKERASVFLSKVPKSDITQVHIVYPVPTLEPPISARSSGSFYWNWILESQIWALGVLMAICLSC